MFDVLQSMYHAQTFRILVHPLRQSDLLLGHVLKTLPHCSSNLGRAILLEELAESTTRYNHLQEP